MSKWNLDAASLGLGLATGAALLAAVLSQVEPESVSANPGVREAGRKGPGIEDVVRLERSRTRHVQSLLDSIIGPGRAFARVAVVAWDDRGDLLTIKKMSLALAVDETKVIYDPATSEWLEMTRSETEVQMLQQLARQTAGLDSTRGDIFTVTGMPIDKSVEIMHRDVRVSSERRRFWTTVALVALGVVIAFSTGRHFLVQSAAAAWLASGVALLALVPGWISAGDAILVGMGVFLVIGGASALVGRSSTATDDHP